MRFLKIILIIAFPLSIFAQGSAPEGNETKLPTPDLNLVMKSNYRMSLLKSSLSYSDSLTQKKESTVKGKTKSPGLAFLYGLLIPGMGHVYSDNFETGKYFLIAEASIWLTYALFTVYGNWLLDDAYDYAAINAGVQVAGKEKDDIFFVNIANYENVDVYNDEMLRFGEYDKLYYPEQGYGFYWNSRDEREIYRSDKLAGDRTLNDRLFVVGAALINHVISAISAVIAANSYNSELKKKSSGGLSLSAGVQRHFNRFDGIKLKLTKFF
jgi:hypothetical protein